MKGTTERVLQLVQSASATPSVCSVRPCSWGTCGHAPEITCRTRIPLPDTHLSPAHTLLIGVFLPQKPLGWAQRIKQVDKGELLQQKEKGFWCVGYGTEAGEGGRVCDQPMPENHR